MAEFNLDRLLNPIMRRVRLILSRGKVTAVNDGHNIQNLQATIFANEAVDDVERMTEYGLISVPLTGSQVVLGFMAGVRAHPVALVVADGRTRPQGLKAGDSGVYHHEGHQILLTENGQIIITCKSLRYEVEEDVTVNCKTWNVNASESADITSKAINFNGDTKTSGTSTAADHVSGGISGSGHKHLVPFVDGPGDTEAPKK